jgi:hypothetical protein
MATARWESEPAGRSWYITCRWQEFQAEGRANLLRIAAVGAFYLVELAHYHGIDFGLVQLHQEAQLARFHQAITALVVAWTALSMGVLLCLQRRVFPAVLKYISTGGDLLLLTCVLLAASGPASPMVAGYFVILAVAALRFSLPLVRCATAGAVAGYLIVLGHARWYAPDTQVPRSSQMLTLVALVLAGVVLGQVVRQAHCVAEEYRRRAAHSGGNQP